MKRKKIIKFFLTLFCILLSNSIFSQKIFVEFKNTDSLKCFEKSYPFYYHFEKDFYIKDMLINEYRIGINKKNSKVFWIGKKGETYYSLIISQNNNILRKEALFLEKNSIFLLPMNKSIKLKFKKNLFVSSNYGYMSTYKINNQSVLKKIFDKRYSNFYLMFSKKNGLDINFDYTDKNINTVYGGCDKL